MYLLNSSQVTGKMKKDEDTLLIQYTGKKKSLYYYIDSLEKKAPFNQIILHAKDYKQLKKDFMSLFDIIHAGGGLVRNPDGAYLFIFRRGKWDLPKGKVDKGESRKTAAYREVQEETGVKKLKQKDFLMKTRHVYRLGRGRRVLKITNWYDMRAPQQKLVPQTKEQITKATWIKPDAFLSQSKYKKTYLSVYDVLEKGLNK